ncbi:hypothetical protein BGZ72_005196 [Mortierella alpina]|nr:hypothetical protein BGZ72_005196 [Mortierella alpina]
MSAVERRNGNGTNDSGRSDDTVVTQSIIGAAAAECDTSKVTEEAEKEELGKEEAEKPVSEKEEEAQVESATPEILAWREKMHSTLTTDTTSRFYLKYASDGVYASWGKPLEPVPIESGGSLLVLVNTTGVPPGWYWVVFGISLKDTDGSARENINFEVMNGDKEGNFYTMVNPCEAVVAIEDLPKDEVARLRLHRQIEINEEPNDCLWVQVESEVLSGSGEEASFDLHYIELASPFKSAEGVKDHILWGEGKPDQFIRVGAQSTNAENNPISIDAYDFSDSGDYVATLYFTTGKAHLDVWDLRASSESLSTDNSQAITTPRAHISFPVASELTTYDALCKAELNVSISSVGSQVVMGYVVECKDAIPLSIYRCSPTAPVDGDVYEPWELNKVINTCESLRNYFGYGSFHISDLDNPKAENERYFTFNGTEFDVYSTEGEWQQLYSLSLGIDKDPLVRVTNTNSLRESLRGRYFAWTGDKSGVSIWDFETGKFVTTIMIPEDSGNVRAALSADGSMVAISVNGSVQIHDVVSGIKMGVYKAGPRDDNELEVVFGRDHFMALNSAKSSSGDRHVDAHSIIRVHDMEIVDTHMVYWQYETEYPSSAEPVFAYSQGATLNIKRLDNILCPIEVDDCGPDNFCKLESTTLDLYYNTWSDQYKSSAEAIFHVEADYEYARGSYFRTLTITNGSLNASISLGPAAKDYVGFFMSASSQVVLIMNGFLQVWHLPSITDQKFELVHVEAYVEVPEVHANDICITEVSSVQACKHGRRFSVELKPTKWLRGLNGEEIKDDLESKKSPMLTFPTTAKNTFSTIEKYRYENGIVSLIDTYADSSPSIKEAVIRFLINHIRPSVAQPVSSLVILCRSWKYSNRIIFEKIITDLLPAARITWIPDINAKKEDDPLSVLTKIAKTSPSVLGACKIIMTYCVDHAIRSRNLSFLSPLFRSMSDIMDLFPEEALEYLGRIAYIPVKRRDYILQNHIVAHSPWMRLQVWKKPLESLDQIKDPVMQLHVTAEPPRYRVDTFIRPIFMASFDALWHYNYNDNDNDNDNDDPKTDVMDEAMMTQRTTWRKTLYHMFLLKFYPKTHAYVKCHEFSVEFFDNPAIAALVEYKWNTIGYAYWAFRFFFQCIFYILVVLATLLQVYHENVSRSQLVGVFITITVVGAVFLWLELLQAIKGFKRYRQYVLFELRIYKSVCKYVTIIRQSVVEIRAFFLIFAGGLVAFTIATLHLLRACPTPGACEEPTTKFSEHFLGALSATYFFMGGRYDPVADEFQSQDWGFHLMMMSYFFFTVIVMMNVLIALINVAFGKGDDAWRLAWVESRLRYIEAAENLSYHVPGFRQSHNWFPKEIYFSATPQQVRAYNKKAHVKAGTPGELTKPEDWTRDYQTEDNDGYQDQGQARPPAPTKMEEAAVQGEDNKSNVSVNGDPEEQLPEETDPTELQSCEGAELEAHPSEDKGKNSINDDSAVQDLKVQVQVLQRQIAALQASQQEQAQRQFQELKDLFLSRFSS